MAGESADWKQLRDLGVDYALHQQHHAACFCLTEALQQLAGPVQVWIDSVGTSRTGSGRARRHAAIARIRSILPDCHETLTSSTRQASLETYMLMRARRRAAMLEPAQRSG